MRIIWNDSGVECNKRYNIPKMERCWYCALIDVVIHCRLMNLSELNMTNLFLRILETEMWFLALATVPGLQYIQPNFTIPSSHQPVELK